MGGQPQGTREAAEAQLVGFFIDGLHLDALKNKLLRENPRDLNAAVNTAMAEQNLRKRFDLRTNRHSRTAILPDEPMEIDHLRPTRPCYYCRKTNHESKDCRIRNRAQVNAVDRGNGRSNNDNSRSNNGNGRLNNNYYPRGAGQGQQHQNQYNKGYFNCGELTHWKRECP